MKWKQANEEKRKLYSNMEGPEEVRKKPPTPVPYKVIDGTVRVHQQGSYVLPFAQSDYSGQVKPLEISNIPQLQEIMVPTRQFNDQRNLEI